MSIACLSHTQQIPNHSTGNWKSETLSFAEGVQEGRCDRCKLFINIYFVCRMGAGRKTETFYASANPNSVALGAPGNNSIFPGFRNLQKSDLGGVIFGCKNGTMEECLTKQLFGMSSCLPPCIALSLCCVVPLPDAFMLSATTWPVPL